MSPTSPQRSHLVERAADAARAAMAADALLAHKPRPPLVERAADAARAAMAADELLARAPRQPLVPVEETAVAAETVVPPVHRRQATARPSHDGPAPITNALLRRAGLVGNAGSAREEIELVREQVLRSVAVTPAAKERLARLVVITSARSGAGSSFTALNLAASIAEDGTHGGVILVDTARGAKSLTARLGLQKSPGLDQLRDSGRNDPAGLLVHSEIPGLSFLPHGTTEPSDAHGSVVAALRHLAERLPDHLILLDTPACLESSTAGLFAAAAGQVALVVEAERTKRAEVESALDILDACPTLQLVLNRTALRVSDRFGGPVQRAGNVAVSAHQA